MKPKGALSKKPNKIDKPFTRLAKKKERRFKLLKSGKRVEHYYQFCRANKSSDSAMNDCMPTN